MEQQEGENEENAAEDHEIRSRKAKRVVIFTDNQENPDSNTYNNSKTKDTTNFDQTGRSGFDTLFTTIGLSSRYNKGLHANTKAKNSYFETVSSKFAFSPFLDRIEKFLFFAFDTSELMKIMFINWMRKKSEFTISDSTYTEEKTKKVTKKKKQRAKTDEKKTNEKKSSYRNS